MFIATNARVGMTAFLVFVLFFALTFSLSAFLQDTVSNVLIPLVGALIEAVFAGMVALLAAYIVRRKRHEAITDLQQIAELNHHVRNALQAITFSATVSTDARWVEVVEEAAGRIDTALNNVMPIVGERQEEGGWLQWRPAI